MLHEGSRWFWGQFISGGQLTLQTGRPILCNRQTVWGRYLPANVGRGSCKLPEQRTEPGRAMCAGSAQSSGQEKVYLDDERPTPADWERAFWPAEVIRLLETGTVTDLGLNHDLSDDERGTGYDVILWFEEAVAVRGFVLLVSPSIQPIPRPSRR